jgi:hypothetical protein
MEWLYTNKEELEMWMNLNEAIDGAIIPKRPLSHLKQIIDFMRPVDLSWVIYVHIDKEVPVEERKALYSALGRILRTDPSSEIPSVKTGLDEFYLHDDPILSSDAPPWMKSHSIDLEDINVLRGIHESSQEGTRWYDIATMVDNPYLLDPAIRGNNPNGTYGEMVEYMCLKPEKNYLAHAMAKLPLPIEKSGYLPIHIEHDRVTPEDMPALINLMATVRDNYLANFVDRSGLDDYIQGYPIHGDGLTFLFSLLPTNHQEAAHFIRDNYGQEGLGAYISILTRYKKLIHLTNKGRNPIAVADRFLLALTGE